AALLLPGGEAAEQVGDSVDAHVLERLGRERRAAAGGAVHHEPLARGELRLVIGRRRVGVELEQAARRMDGARDLALGRQLTAFAHVDEHHVVAADQLRRFRDVQRLDRGVRLGDQLGSALDHVLLLRVSQALSSAARIAASSNAGSERKRPKPCFTYHTENASMASGLGASTMSTKSTSPWV